MSAPAEREPFHMRYVHASRRDGCQNCTHAVETRPHGQQSNCRGLSCTKASLTVTRLSICNLHEPKEVSREVKHPLVA